MYESEHHAHDAYSRSLGRCSPVDQLVMLYDGMISFVKQAKSAIREEHWELRWNLIERAGAILNGLHEALEGDSAAASALARYYADVEMCLIKIQCHNDTDLCDTVIRDLKTMRDTWAEIAAAERANEDAGTGVTSMQGVSPHGQHKLPAAGAGLAISA